MKAMVKEWINALAKFDNADLAELEKGIMAVRYARREEEKNQAIQNFKQAYLELCKWVNIYYDIGHLSSDATVALLDVFDNFSFELE